MKTALNTVRVGLFFLLGVTLIWITYEMLSEGRVFRDDTYKLHARFDNIQALRSGDDVRMSGVRIGRVSETRLDNGRALAVLDILPGVGIPSDSVATISMSSLLGANFVAIEPGDFDAGILEPSSEIATRRATDLNEIFARFGDATEGLGDLFGQIGGAVDRLTGTDKEPGVLDKLNEILAENRDTIRSALANIDSITEKIDRGDGTLARLINDDTAYQSLLATVEEIRAAVTGATELVDGAQEIFTQIQSGKGTLGRLIYDEEIGLELERIAGNIREISDKIAAGEGTLGRLVTDDSLYRDIQAVIQKAERTIDGLGEQGPITAVGIAANALF